MHDKAHIRLVDAHAEGDGRNQHKAFLGEKASWLAGADFRVEPGMVGQRADAVGVKRGGGFLDGRPAQAIDDAALALMARRNVSSWRCGHLSADHGIADVRAGRSSVRNIRASSRPSRRRMSSRVTGSAVAVRAMRGTPG